MEQMKVGIIGAGRIAANMAKTLNGMDDAVAYAIAEILTEHRNLLKNGDLKRHMAHTKSW